MSARYAELERTPGAVREAEVAALVARATNVPVATYDALGSWGARRPPVGRRRPPGTAV